MNTNVPADTTRIGHLLSPHGVQGAVKLYVLGSAEQLKALKRVYVEGLGWLKVNRLEQHQTGPVLHLAGINDRDAALTLRGKQVYAHDNELPPLPEGEYYYHELRGLRVTDAQGGVLGEVSDVLDMGHQDVLVITTPAGHDGLVPLQAPYVQVKRRVSIVLTEDAPEGLLGEGLLGEDGLDEGGPDEDEQAAQP